MRVSDYASPTMVREHKNLALSVVSKMNCTNHLIQVQVGQFTVDLPLNSAKWLARSLQSTIDEVDDTVENRALAHLKNYKENG